MIKILTNHIGYDSHGPKHAVVLCDESDRPTAFQVHKYDTGEQVLSGTPKKVGPVHKWRNWYFWTIDFDAVAEEGEYVIKCVTPEGTTTSFPFMVRPNVLERHALSNTLWYLKGQRCSGLLDKADRQVKFFGPRAGEVIDAHGGWYDATGDYGKHLSQLCFASYFNTQQIPLTAWAMFRAYQALDERQDPNFRQYKRRLLDEGLFGADYLVRIHKPGGSFYITVSGPGPEKKPEDRRIAPVHGRFMLSTEEERDKTYTLEDPENAQLALYEVSYRSGGGVAVAALARAAACGASGDFENADYLDAAEDAFAFLEAHNDELTNDGKDNILDDYCALLAAAELYKATKKAVYKQAADKRARSLMARLTSSNSYENYWRADDDDRPFFHPSDAGLPVVSLLDYLEIADEATQAQVLDVVAKSLRFDLQITGAAPNPFGYALQLVQNTDGVRREAFFFPHDTETGFWWQGENARLGSIAAAARLAARHFKRDQAFHDSLQAFAWDQLNWVLGLNPFDMCMLHGSGRNNPEYLFFDGYEYTNAPGGICNGITAGLYDEEDIDFHRKSTQTGADDDWRWTEQWLPHGTWFLLAVAVGM